MPIIVQQTPVGVLGQLAVLAGQARAQEVRMGRDIQLTSLALAAQDRAAEVGMAAHDRAFALQRAASEQMVRERPAAPDDTARRQGLQRFVSEAEETGIYEPTQIKQMQIFANLGDEQAVRSIAVRLPEVTTRRQELGEQTRAITAISQSQITELQKQFDTTTDRLDKQFTTEAQDFLRKNLRFATQEVQDLFMKQEQLKTQMAAVSERASQAIQMRQMGITTSEQMAFEAQQEGRLQKQEEAEQRRLLTQRRGETELTDAEKTVIDLTRDREKEQRTAVDREINNLTKDLAPFKDESTGDHQKRISPLQSQIQQLTLARVASFAREKQAVEQILRAKQVTPFMTDAAGQKWRFTGQFQKGKPVYVTVGGE